MSPFCAWNRPTWRAVGVRRLAISLAFIAGAMACDEPTKPGSPVDPLGELPRASVAAPLGSLAPGTFSVTVGVNPFNEQQALPLPAETLMYNAKATGVVIDYRCSTDAPYMCSSSPPTFTAAGKWFPGWNAYYGRIYVSATVGSYYFTAPSSSTNDTVSATRWVIGGAGIIGRSNRDPTKCGTGTSPCSYSPTGSHTITFTPTHSANTDLETDSNLVNPGSVATFKVTNLSSSANAVTLLKWTWVPDEGEPVDLTGCPLGTVHKYASPTCPDTIYTSGTMYTRTKQAGGTIEQQDARVDVRPLSVTADRMDVDAGDTITFRSKLGETPALITSWRWSGDSSSVTACAGDSLCPKFTSDTGTFTMVGSLTEGTLTLADTVTVRVRPATPILKCPSGVDWGATATCNIVLPNAGSPYTIGQWAAMPWALDDTIPGQSGVGTWGGRLVTSVNIAVHVRSAVSDTTFLEASIEVTRRSWTWTTPPRWQRGGLGEIDACMPTGYYGLMAGISCQGQPWPLLTPGPDSLESLVTVDNVADNGPNHTIWYVASRTVKMDLRTQIIHWYRSDGDTYPLIGSPTVINGCQSVLPGQEFVSMHAVNTQCAPLNAFADLLVFAWGHEARHADSALVAAQTVNGNLPFRLEPLVTRDSLELVDSYTFEYLSANAYIGEEANRTHTGACRIFKIWTPDFGSWAQRNERLNDYLNATEFQTPDSLCT